MAEAQDIERRTGDNVEQIKDTKRDKVMTFSYDMSLDPEYEKPTYVGTGNGLGGEKLKDEYDIIVIGSGMGGLACGALSAEYGSNVAVLESHIKPGGSAHTFSRMHNGGKYSFEVGPSIFEGLNGPSFNPLRTILDMLGEDLKCETYTGLGYWTPEGYWRFPIGSEKKFEDLIYERCGKEEGDKAVEEWSALRARLKTLGGSTTVRGRPSRCPPCPFPPLAPPPCPHARLLPLFLRRSLPCTHHGGGYQPLDCTTTPPHERRAPSTDWEAAQSGTASNAFAPGARRPCRWSTSVRMPACLPPRPAPRRTC